MMGHINDAIRIPEWERIDIHITARNNAHVFCIRLMRINHGIRQIQFNQVFSLHKNKALTKAQQEMKLYGD